MRRFVAVSIDENWEIQKLNWLSSVSVYCELD